MPSPPLAPPSSDITLRPSFAAYGAALRQRARILGAFVAVALIGQALQAGSVSGAVFRLGGIAAVVGLCIGGIAIHFRTARIVLAPGSIERSGALVRRRRFATATVDGVLVELLQPMTAPTRLLVLAGPDDHGRRHSFRLTAAVWSDGQLETIARHAAIQPTPGMLGGAEVERLLPGSMPIWYRRPWLFATLVTIALLIAIVGGVLGFFVVTDRPPFDDRPPAEESAAATSAVVEEHAGVLAAIQSALPGTWDPSDVDYLECETDNVKGWRRYTSVTRPDGPSATAEQLDAVEADLLARGFDEPAFSRPPDPGLHATDGDFDTGWTTVEVVVGDDGNVWAEVSSPCLVG